VHLPPPKQRLRLPVRVLLETVFVLAAALTGGLSVYAGEAYQWPGFNVRSGYWGTDFMRSLLVSLGSDVSVKVVVASCWAQYAAVPALAGVVLMRFGFPDRRLAN
jgi:hypothetical protein